MTDQWVWLRDVSWRDADDVARQWADRGATGLAVSRFHDEAVALDPFVALGAYQGSAQLGVAINVDEGRSGAVAAREITTLSYLAPIATLIVTSRDRQVALDHAEAAAALLTHAQISLNLPTWELHDAANRPQPHHSITVIATHSDEAWVLDGSTRRPLNVMGELRDGVPLPGHCLVVI